MCTVFDGAPGRIVLVSGPPGAGKSTVAARLAGMAEGLTVHMPTDSFYTWIRSGYVPPYLPESERQNKVVLNVMIEAACAYAAGGYEVILDGVLGLWMLEPFAAACRERGLDLSYVVLRPNLEITLARGVGREGEDELREVEPITQMHRVFEDLGTFESHVIDSGGHTAEETAAAIVSGLRTDRFAVRSS